MQKKNNYLLSIIFGFLFSLVGIIPISFMLRDLKKVVWNSNTIIPLLLLCIFIFYGLLLAISSIVGYIKVKKYNIALENNCERTKLFELEDDARKFRDTETMIMTAPVPFILISACIALLVNQIKKRSISGIVILVLMCLFLLFICVGLICMFLQKKRNDNIENIKAKLKNIYLAHVITTYNNKVTIDEYQVELSYKVNNQEKSILIPKTYSKEQIQLMENLEYIPVVKKGKYFEIDNKEFANISTIYNETAFDFDNVKTYKTNQYKNENNVNKPQSHQHENKEVKTLTKLSTGVNVIFLLILPIFATVFIGIGIFSLVYFIKKDLTVFNIIVSIVHILFALFVYASWVKMLCSGILKKRTLKYGEKSFASSYELIDTSTSSDSMNTNFRFGIKFTFTDQNGIQRKATETLLKISIFKFREANIKRLPILTYKKTAIIDYEELTKLL